jgi:hypothetical protein
MVATSSVHELFSGIMTDVALVTNEATTSFYVNQYHNKTVYTSSANTPMLTGWNDAGTVHVGSNQSLPSGSHV